MACVVTDKCVDCTTRSCLPVCPINCFFETDGKMVYASQDECFECLCCYMACPKEAIYIEAALPDDMKKWKEINAEVCRSPGAKRLGQISADYSAGMLTYQAGRCAATALLGMDIKPASVPAKSAPALAGARPAPKPSEQEGGSLRIGRVGYIAG